VPSANHSSRSAPPCAERRIILLGSTGSIGTQALEVIDNLNTLADRGESPVRYRVVGLAAGRNVAMLSEQARRYPDARLAVAHADVRDLAIGEQGESASFSGRLLRSLHGDDAAERLVREVECDVVLAAMVGAAGLPATLAAVELGRDVALANKETLVAAGELVIPAARISGSKLLPVDSEHAGVWQCLPGLPCPPMTTGPEVARIVLTASGGPFRTWSAQDIARATPEQALKHPTWAMGQKVTIDSASLTNKALEVIEAHWLFGVDAERIGVVIHPQSIVHALVELSDGNVIAQLAPPDMKTPIQIALTFPHRAAGCSKKLDWRSMSRLDFEQPDFERFPALSAAYDVIRAGGTSGAVFNAANEVAVEAFLSRKIAFGMIPKLSRAALENVGVSKVRSLRDVLDADSEARRFVTAELSRAMVPA
jgi:1-deoxy-D-xylulose-5-phosphate reductoisomerase